MACACVRAVAHRGLTDVRGSETDLTKFVPPRLCTQYKSAYYLQRIVRAYHRLRGTTRRAALIEYLNIAQTSMFYGEAFIPFSTSDGAPCLLGIAEDGVLVANAASISRIALTVRCVRPLMVRWLTPWRRCALQKLTLLPFPDISDISAMANGITIAYRLKDGSAGTMQYQSDDYLLLSTAFLLLCDYYRLFLAQSGQQELWQPNLPSLNRLPHTAFGPIIKRVVHGSAFRRSEVLKTEWLNAYVRQARGDVLVVG